MTPTTNPTGVTLLVDIGEAPFDAEGVREQIGLLDPSFDKLIQAVIYSQCIKHGCQFTGAIWAVPRGDDLGEFFKTARSIGKLVKIGPAYDRNGITYHDCEYGVDPRAVAKAFRSVCNWCWDDLAIGRAILRERRGEYRVEWPARDRALGVPAVAAE